MKEEEFDFADFRNNDIVCDKCGESMGCSSEQLFSAFLCDDCANELEQKYKKKHPEEYEE